MQRVALSVTDKSAIIVLLVISCFDRLSSDVMLTTFPKLIIGHFLPLLQEAFVLCGFGHEGNSDLLRVLSCACHDESKLPKDAIQLQ